MQKSLKAAKKSVFRQFINNSIIVSILTYFSARLHSLFSKRALSKVFTFVDYADKSKDEGLIHLIAEKTKATTVFSAIRRGFAKSVENSFIVKLYRQLIKAFMATSVKTFGVFFMSAGLYSLLAYSIRLFVFMDVKRTQTEVVAIALMVLISFFLIFSKKSLGKKLIDSGIFYFFLDLLGINRLAIDTDRQPQNHFAAAFFAGLAFGIGVFFLSPLEVIYRIAVVLTTLIILYSPESGLLISMAAVPFGNEDKLLFVLFITLVSYILKLFRGKRNLTLKSEDYPALFFALVFMYAFNGFSAIRLFIIVSSYFMASNLMRNANLLKKSIYSFALGLMIKSVVLTTLFMFNFVNINFTAVTGILVGEFNLYSEFMIIASLPFAFYMFGERESGFHFIIRLIFVLSVLFNAAVSMSDMVWFSAVICLFIYLVYRTARFFNVAFVFALVCPILYYVRQFVLVFNTVTPFEVKKAIDGEYDMVRLLFGGGNFGGSSVYGVLAQSIGILGLALLGVFLVFLLSRSFTSALYSRKGRLRPICAILITGLSVFLVTGMSANTFETSNGLLMFWILCGLVSATGNAIPTHVSYDDYT